MRNYLLICVVLLAGARAMAQTVPAGVTDPGRSVWIIFTAPPQTHGLAVRPSGEGKPRQMTVDGQPALTVDAAGGRMLYLQVAPWFTPAAVDVTVDYFDCGTGRVTMPYDSLDETSKTGNEWPGAWKGAKEVITCAGSNTWSRAPSTCPTRALPGAAMAATSAWSSE